MPPTRCPHCAFDNVAGRTICKQCRQPLGGSVGPVAPTWAFYYPLALALVIWFYGLGVFFLVLFGFTEAVGCALVPLLSLTCLHAAMRTIRAPSTLQPYAWWVAAATLVLVITLCLTPEAEEVTRRCLFGGTVEQHDQCMAEQRGMIRRRDALYVGGVTVVCASGMAVHHHWRRQKQHGPAMIERS